MLNPAKFPPEPRNQAMPGVFQAAAPQRSARPNLAGVFAGPRFTKVRVPQLWASRVWSFGASEVLHGLRGVGLVSPVGFYQGLLMQLYGVYKAWVCRHMLTLILSAETKVPPEWSFGFP